MDFFLFFAAAFAFWAAHPASALILRCGLEAGMHVSARAALALSSVSALCASGTGLLCRHPLRSLARSQSACTAAAGFIGGTLGRAALIMFIARFPDSLLLARVQAAPLLLMMLCSLLSANWLRIPVSLSGLFACSALLGAVDGFFGAGGMPLFMRLSFGGVSRSPGAQGCALIHTLCAQAGALILTALTGQLQVFPARMLGFLIAGSALGAVLLETQKERGALPHPVRITLLVYGVLAALACIGHTL